MQSYQTHPHANVAVISLTGLTWAKPPSGGAKYWVGGTTYMLRNQIWTVTNPTMIFFSALAARKDMKLIVRNYIVPSKLPCRPR